MIDIEVGTRITNRENLKGKVVQYRKSQDLIVIEWEGCGTVAYTESMFNEVIDSKVLSIDSEYYRNEKLDELGI